jgi:hypothetical protein
MTMPAITLDSAERARAIGELCVEGDRASSLGELDALGAIAERIAAYVEEPLHCELRDVVQRCRGEPAAAIAAWMGLKDRILGTGAEV